jgi:hypothetical protein
MMSTREDDRSRADLVAAALAEDNQKVPRDCPASLVDQWIMRLRTMFDIRLAKYTVDADSPRVDFWGTHNQVAVSLQTPRRSMVGTRAV